MTWRLCQLTEACFRYSLKLEAENNWNLDLLIRLAHAYQMRDFGLRFLYLRATKEYIVDHKDFYRNIFFSDLA